jgi:hypothetical protein
MYIYIKILDLLYKSHVLGTSLLRSSRLGLAGVWARCGESRDDNGYISVS